MGRTTPVGRRQTSRPGRLTLRRFQEECSVSPASTQCATLAERHVGGSGGSRGMDLQTASTSAACSAISARMSAVSCACPRSSNRVQVLSHHVGLRRHQGASLLDKCVDSPSLFQDFQRISARPGSIHRNRAKRGSQSACMGAEIAITWGCRIGRAAVPACCRPELRQRAVLLLQLQRHPGGGRQSGGSRHDGRRCGCAGIWDERQGTTVGLQLAGGVDGRAG